MHQPRSQHFESRRHEYSNNTVAATGHCSPRNAPAKQHPQGAQLLIGSTPARNCSQGTQLLRNMWLYIRTSATRGGWDSLAIASQWGNHNLTWHSRSKHALTMPRLTIHFTFDTACVLIQQHCLERQVTRKLPCHPLMHNKLTPCPIQLSIPLVSDTDY